METNSSRCVPLAPEVEAEIGRFEQEIALLQRGERDPDDFRRFRLENGVYGIRDTTDRHMVRVKVPLGILTPEQLETLADIAEHYTPLQIAHITTRQDIQFHNIKQTDVPVVLRMIAECGLTTREACGNTVRNVTCCPLAGIATDEPFDVTPYALATSRFFLRNPVCQNMPRKFKIAFEGCGADHARLLIHDLGFQAMLQEHHGRLVRGFRTWVGGGLGPIPVAAQLLEEFTPAELLLPTVEATLRLFDRHGNRQDRNRARLKFVLKDWGIEELRGRWMQERRTVLATRSGHGEAAIATAEETPPPAPEVQTATPSATKEFERWRAINSVAQKQRGFFAAYVRCPLGDVTALELRGLANVARQYCGGRVRATITQNLVLRWAPETHLANVHQELSRLGLAQHGAERLADVTRCPAADTCQLGITHSRGLAQALGELLNNGLAADPVLEGLSIKISGCPNSCGQHHLADIGFLGNSKTVDGHQVGFYRMMLGGGTTVDRAFFGAAVMALPAKRTPEALKKLLSHYRDTRRADETFRDFAQRMGPPHFQQLLAEFAALPPYRERPDLYGDLGIEGEFKVKIGKGECAA